MIISQAEQSDSSALAYVHADCFASNWSGEYFQKALTNQNYRCIKCLINDSIVGFCLYSFIKPEIEIITICVLEQFRRMKIAKSMLRHIIGTENFDTIFLETAIYNKPAIELYKSIGFQKYSERRNYYHENGTTYDALLFKYTIEKMR